MSLVNEALRKARLEAARQEAARRGAPPPLSGPYSRRRSRRWPLAAAAAVVLALAALLFWAGRRSAQGPPVAEPQAAAATTPSAAEPVAPTAAEPAVQPPPQAPADAPPDRSAEARPGQPAPSPPPQPAEVAPRADDPPVRIALQDRSLSGSPSRPVGEAEAGETEPLPSYLRTADLPGGRLELGGIAWSSQRPFALINGTVVGPGDRVEQYTVVRVEPQQVEMAGARGSFILRLK